jgi:tripartite motif-containing protein 37
VFLELVNSIRRDNLFEYQIELVNQRNTDSRMLREYNSNFEPAECWGYNKYIKLDALLNEGYLLNDTIILKYYVRQPSYYQVSIHKAIYSEYLDRELARQEEEIKHLEEMLMKQSTISIQ